MAKKRTRTDAERRVRQCERLGKLLRTLQLIMGKGRWDADGLAEELECSRRTVYRMLQTLSLAGVPWYFDETVRAYRVRPGFRLPGLAESSGNQFDMQTDPQFLVTARDVIRSGETFLASVRELCHHLEARQIDPEG